MNQGLVGMGRLSATLKDFMGTSLGSFSGMAIDPTTWRKAGNGYAATLYSLPDRGYNTGDLYSDYQGRLVRFDLSFTPYTGAGLPAATTSQSQITLTPTGDGIKLTDFNGTATTGLDPAAGTTAQNGYTLPSPTGTGTRRVALDAEAVAFLPDGSFYVGDEYTAGIYLFDKSGKMIGYIAPPAALQPMTGGQLNYNSIAAPNTGRRNNQGMEAVALSPDGTRLIAILQSATIQDGAGNAGNRGNTRVLIYDVSASRLPTTPVEHYILQLPLLDDTGKGGAVNKTAAQSEVVAINNHQFLVLSRDSAGYGVDGTLPEMYKSILLVDTKGATNLAGTAYETTTKPVSTGKTLDPSITPVQQGELVNMLNTTQLARFGMNINTATPAGGTNLTLSEKWEAMALMPALDEAKPQDFFLFVANDNDFQTTDGVMPGYTYDAGRNNDTMLMAFRLTLPTAVDPLFEAAMLRNGAAVSALAGETVTGAADQGIGQVTTHLGVLRTEALSGAGRGKAATDGEARVWLSGLYGFGDLEGDTVQNDTTNYAGAVGVDLLIDGGFTFGLAFGLQGGSNEPDGGFKVDHDGYAISAYGQYVVGGFSVAGAYSYMPMNLDDIRRPSAYGLSGVGSTDAAAHVFAGEAAYHLDLGGVKAGPLVNLGHVRGRIDGYTERGAAGGNVTYAGRSFRHSTAGVGAEAILPLTGVSLTGRAVYTSTFDTEGNDAGLRLSSVAGGATTAVAVPTGETDTVTLGLRAQGAVGAVGWYAGYDLDIGLDGGLGNTLTTGVSLGF
ncbi:autotransporter outer membrane beta-barrel domain-containing protein [Zavarzinia compransoris]|uniref:Autotransporter outer membrane beta-barrel domain-containing protein n=1 Tax=Zavarzinia compransoris TaxID=1264899 RepID=A0A317E732_9PROT|nr:autotransporter outer membrane beta-barrel domain-containing protein [Zavarzinia compransoris]